MNIQNPQLKDLEQISQRTQIESGVAMESYGDSFRKIIPTMRASLSSYADTVRTNLAALSSRNVGEFNSREFEQLVSLMEKHQHINVIDLRFYVPEGFRGNIVDYSKLLIKVQAHTNKVIADVLTPFNVYLSKLLSDKNAAAENGVQMAQLIALRNEREVLRQAMEEYFPKGSTNAAIKVGEAIDRKQDWAELAFQLKTLSNNFDKKMPGKVTEAINHCAELLEALSDSSIQGGMDAISAQQLRTLGDSTLEVAKEVEFFSVVNYQISTLMTVMAQNAEFLKKALTK